MDQSVLGSATGSWELRQSIMEYIVESLPVSRTQDNIAAMIYDSEPELRFRLNKYYNEALIRQLVQNFPTSSAVSGSHIVGRT